jgi:hypothetical protein
MQLENNRNLLRHELGLTETTVPAADSNLQIDVVLVAAEGIRSSSSHDRRALGL